MIMGLVPTVKRQLSLFDSEQCKACDPDAKFGSNPQTLWSLSDQTSQPGLKPHLENETRTPFHNALLQNSKK